MCVLENPDLKVAWVECTEDPKACIETRFRRLSLKNEPMQIMQPMPIEQIDCLKRYINYLFPEMDVTKLTKTHPREVDSYNNWLGKHCIQHQYCFQIRKCEDFECFSPLRSKVKPLILAAPAIDDTKERFFAFKEAVGNNSESDRPSFKLATEVKEQATKGKGQTSVNTPIKHLFAL